MQKKKKKKIAIPISAIENDAQMAGVQTADEQWTRLLVLQ